MKTSTPVSVAYEPRNAISGVAMVPRITGTSIAPPQVAMPAMTMIDTSDSRFPKAVVAAIHEGPILGIRAGTQPHRVIGIWAVVVEGRVFVRSWSLKPQSWYRTFLEEPRGIVQAAGRTIAVRAVRTRSERLKDAIDRAYLEKYHTPGAVKFARDLGRAKSRATTTELVPV